MNFCTYCTSFAKKAGRIVKQRFYNPAMTGLNPVLKKRIFMRIKFTAFLIALACIHVYADGNAQSITLSEKNARVEKVFKEINKQTGFIFWYENSLLKDTKKVNVSVRNATIKQALDVLLNDQPLTYSIIEKTVVIKKKEEVINKNSSIYLQKEPGQFIQENETEKRIENLLGNKIAEFKIVNIDISGKVSDEQGGGLPGVSVVLKGTQRGTTTDVEGNFKISIQDGSQESVNPSLIFSFVGYLSQELPVGNRTTMDVSLKVDTKALAEVVVVGYGTQTRKDITGAISSINEKTLKEVPVTNAQQMLQGRVAGVYVTQTSNKPGSEPTVKIRGNRSVSGGNDPLYVVDGIPISGGFNDISPNDIESMEILKDASATAIYGSRGANGVIIISTKRGKEGKPVVSYNTWFGATKIVRYADVFKGAEFVEFKREANRAINNYNDTDPAASDAKIFEPGEILAIKEGRYTNWPSQIAKSGFSQNHELSVLGGSKTTRYNFSLGYLNDQGYFSNQDYKRYTTRINLDQDLNKKVKVGLSMLGTFSERNGGDINPYMASLVQTPLGAPYDDKGNLVPFPTGDALMYNLLTDFVPGAVINKEKRFRLLSSLYAEAEIMKGLKFRMNFGPDLINSRKGNFQKSNTSARQGGLPAASSGESFVFSYTWENMLTYDKTIADKHKINFTGLYSIQDRTLESSSVNVTNLPAESVEYYNFGSANTISGVGSGYEKWTILSYMGRLNYSFDSRFIFTLTARADGSSRFAPGHKWGFFPSAAFAYNLSDEKFMKSFRQLSNLKLRVSYGKIGNTGISPYQTQGLLETTGYDFNGTNAFGRRPASITNPLLRWESTSTLNAGVDFGLHNNRFTGTVEVYKAKTTDLLLAKLLPNTTGYSSTLSNIGSTSNSGVEVTLGSNNVVSRTNGFEWSTDLNFAYNRERILVLSQGKVDDIGNSRFIGQPLSVYYDYQKLGIWQLGQEDEAKKYSSSVGQIKVADRNGNGVIDPADRMILGKLNPPWTFGFNNRFSYKGFDLAIFAVARSGNILASLHHSVPNNTIALGGRYNMLDVDYWTPNNPTNAYPRPINGQSGSPGPVFGSTLKYFDGSFIRIRNINFGYNVPSGFVQKIKAQSIRLSFNVTNPFLFSSYVSKNKGIDPEIMDNPAVVNYLFGLNIKF